MLKTNYEGGDHIRVKLAGLNLSIVVFSEEVNTNYYGFGYSRVYYELPSFDFWLEVLAVKVNLMSNISMFILGIINKVLHVVWFTG